MPENSVCVYVSVEEWVEKLTINPMKTLKEIKSGYTLDDGGEQKSSEDFIIEQNE